MKRWYLVTSLSLCLLAAGAAPGGAFAAGGTQSESVQGDAPKAKLVRVEGTYTYRAPENVALAEARRIALERAKIQALADQFGTIIMQSNSTRVANSGGSSSVDYVSISASDVKGEWIETLGEPKETVSYEGDMLVVTVSVVGKAREVTEAAIDFQVRVLRNGSDDKNEDDRFRENDYLYLSFQSPVAGYLAVYLIDDDRQAFCLLPYGGQQDGIYPIEANRRYLFFKADEAPQAERALVDEYYMTCSRETEHNQIYVIFSPNEFAKATDASIDTGLPRQLSYKDFDKWLANCRKRDSKMNRRVIPIQVSKK